jgi:hypothetical protein
MGYLWIEMSLVRVRPARGDQTNHIASSAAAMDHDKETQAGAEAEKHETLFVLGMIRIVDEKCALCDVVNQQAAKFTWTRPSEMLSCAVS